MADNNSHTTTDHKTIRQWAEAREGKPTAVKATHDDNGDTGILRIDFPGYSGQDDLTPISWDEFFEAFENNTLAFLYQEETSDGEKSRFYKFINRQSDSHNEGTHHMQTLKDLYIDQLKDIYSAETQLMEALPKMAKAAADSQLQQAFEHHLEETRRHVERLEKIFDNLDTPPGGETCEAMQGLIKEGEKMVKKDADNDVKDAGLIASAQRVEHYEIAAYGTVRTFAQRLGMSEAAELLQETLDEEKNADTKLSNIAMSDVNKSAENA